MKTILLVEDDDSLRELVGVLLRVEGYEVDEAENGKVALDRLHQMDSLPCLILLDLMMPIMSGPQLLQALNQHERLASLPVIVLSANDPPSDVPRDVPYLRKPVDPYQLATTVREYCGSPQ